MFLRESVLLATKSSNMHTNLTSGTALSKQLQINFESINQIETIQRILEVVCRTTGLGFSAVARVTDCKWIACAVRDEIAFGLKPGEELVLETTICNEIRQSHELVVIENVGTDPKYGDHPTPKMYGFKSYISVPITLPDGEFFGTLCAIDPSPAQLKRGETVGMFKLFAELIAMHIDSLHQVHLTERQLLAERELARLQAQYIAVLGHDLRNPLAAIQFGTDILGMMPQTPEALEVVDAMKRSVRRIDELIENVLSHARSNREGGIQIRQTNDVNFGDVLAQVVRELQMVSPERQIEFQCSISIPVECDSDRICQMLSNLVANALTHGDPLSPVWVTARTATDQFEIIVENLGETIPSHKMEGIFEAFAQGESRAGKGLGLGLYIATEIARAHHGTLSVTSAEGRTCFTFRMPNSRRD